MINLAVLFGGRSVEHEISIISAVQAMQSLDTAKYDVIPIYIAKDGRFYTGSALMEISNYKNMPALIKQCKRVIVTRETAGVYIYEKKGVKVGKKALFRIDVVLPVVHGTNCEDGTLQGWLEMLDIPYAGCSVEMCIRDSVRIKTSSGWGITRRKAEYDDLANIAKGMGISIEEVKEKLKDIL